jgi:hypothetical protein
MKENGWIGVDLDGTLAHYDGWKGVGIIGDPIFLMLARVKDWLEQGKEVRIFTARVGGEDAIVNEKERRAIEAWCVQHLGQPLETTCCKDYLMEECWDDRAVQVHPNTGLRADGVIDVPPEPGDIGAAME